VATEDGPSSESRPGRWREYRWLAGVLSALAALILGYIGITEYLKHLPDQPHRTPADILYLTFRLFTLDGDWIVGQKNWPLMVAKFLAPAVTAYTAALTVLAVFRRQIQQLRVRLLWRNHVIICGLGRKGMQLLREFRRRGDRVVAIECNEGNDDIPTARTFGAVVLVGDAADELMLRRAGINKAGRVLCVCGEDGVNVESAVRAFEQIDNTIPANASSGTLSCRVHLVDGKLCELFKQHTLFARHDDRFEAVVFNTYANAARLLWNNNPLDRVRIGPDDARVPHLVVLGFGPMGQSVLLAAAKVGHYANGRKLAVTVAAADLESQRRHFIAQYPQLERVIDVHWMAQDVEDPQPRTRLEELASDESWITTVAVCLDERDRNLPVALNLPRVVHRRNIPVHVWLSERTGLASLLEGDRRSAAVGRNINPFGEVEKVCSLELVLREKLDQLAKMVHQSYINKRTREGAKPQSDPALVPWGQLGEGLKESNRQQADHIAVKLRAIGCGMIPADSSANRPERTINASELEVLAKMEHARWNADRFLAGWTLGDKNTAELKTPYLVSWEELSEEIRDYDREPVRNLPALAREMGMRIVQSNNAA
jgi:hypothetical protein